MKYVMVVGDGMADFPLEALDGRTPLEYLAPIGFARIAGGRLGRLRSCPECLPPGSDTAFLTLLGNDTARVYTGRSPLEAAGLGINMRPDEVAFRMNLAAIDDREGYDRAVMLSHNGGGIDGTPALTLAQALMDDPGFSALLRECGMRLQITDTFRHAALMPGEAAQFVLTPPHDIVGQSTAEYLPGGTRGDLMCRLQRASWEALRDHPVNRERRANGQLAANCAWFWGAGTACTLESFSEKYGVRGMVISAVPLVKGIARLGGLEAPENPRFTGLLDTDYEGKVQCALDALADGYDFALVHLEAPDEMSHDGSLENKLEAIRRLNGRVVEPLLERLPQLGDFRLLLMPDHYTLLSTRTHDGTPVPFALYDSRQPGSPRAFTEAACADAPAMESGDALMRLLFER